MRRRQDGGAGFTHRLGRYHAALRRTHYRWLKTDHAYKGAFERAKVEAARGLEDEARRRAFEGVLEGDLNTVRALFQWLDTPAALRR